MGVNYEDSTYTTQTGHVFTLRPVSRAVVAKLQGIIEREKPQPPIVEVNLGGETRRQQNPDDPDYKDRLMLWQNDRRQDLIVYIFTNGIANDVPPDDLERLRYFFPNSPTLELKYAWVIEQLGEGDNETGGEWETLTDAILSINQVTKRGVDESMDRFRSDGGDDTDTGLPVIEAADFDHVYN